MIEEKKQWLLGVTWESIVNVNRTLCEAQKMEPLFNSATFDVARGLWERAVKKSTNLLEALEACRKAFDLSPFTFNNGNTFASIGRSLVDDYLHNAPAVESQIIRATVGHYAAGKIGRKEFQQVLAQLAPILAKSPARAPVPPAAPVTLDIEPATPTEPAAPAAPAAPEMPAPRLTEARPVA